MKILLLDEDFEICNLMDETLKTIRPCEVLSAHSYYEVVSMKEGLDWHDRYNNFNPHSSLGMMTPAEFARRSETMLIA